MSKLQQFFTYLYARVGNPYLWGGTNTKLTKDNYITVCNKMEANTGNDYAATAVAFCRKRFDEGADELRAFDCSGLMRHWARINKGLYSGKTNADGFYRSCTETEDPVPGCWLFRFSDSSRTKATHIGYLTDRGVVHAKGRAFGVVLEDFQKTRDYWQAAGIPACFAEEIAAMAADDEGPASDQGPLTDDAAMAACEDEGAATETGQLQQIAAMGRIADGAEAEIAAMAARDDGPASDQWLLSENAAMADHEDAAASAAVLQTEVTAPEKYVLVKGNVRVRTGPGTNNRKLGTARNGNRLPYISTDYSTGWHRVRFRGTVGFISGKPKYTEVVDHA